MSGTIDSISPGNLPAVSFVQRTDIVVSNSGFVSPSSPGVTSRPSFVQVFAALIGSDITTALGYIPYSNTNPSGYLTPSTGVVSFNSRQGAITLTGVDITAALGYTPYPASNPAGYISGSVPTTFTGAVTFAGGGTLDGTLVNAGTISGGTLAGTILNTGTIVNTGTISGGVITASQASPTLSVTATGTTQGTGLVVTAQRVIVTGGAGLAVVATTPVFVAQEIWNRTGGTLLIFPIAGAQFETNGVNQSFTIANNQDVKVVYTTSTQAYIG